MISYFLNSGLKREKSVKSEYIKFQYQVQKLSETLQIGFNLNLAEIDNYDLLLIQDQFNKQILNLTIKNRRLNLKIWNQEIHFQHQLFQNYRLNRILLSLGTDAHLVFGSQIVTSQLDNKFELKSNKLNITLGGFTGFFSKLDIKGVEQQEFKKLLDQEVKDQRYLQSEIAVEMAASIQYKQPFIVPLKTIQELEQWEPQPNFDILPIQKLRNIRRKNKQQVLLCHDMMGGYTEDSFNFGTQDQNSYRFHYFLHCDIFIYFSHHFITIPTIPYINVCHQYGVKILGTIITEGDSSQISNDLLNKQNADQLYKICEYYKFDGYLLNIETNVSNKQSVLDFSSYLSQRLQNINAILIYYDSLTKDGKLKWQSELNQENDDYFKASGYFFSDYHWNLDKLQNTARNAADKQDKVFVGIDVWGRGQYGGGQENSYIALQEIKKNNLSVAFFGQAWTYESAINSKLQFIQQDQSFWQGKSIVRLFDKQRNTWSIDNNGGQGWKIIKENDQEIAICSFEWCIRSFLVDLQQVDSGKQGVVQFTAKVRGTGPMFNDPYLLAIELYDVNYICIGSISSFSSEITNKQININNVTKATQNWVEHSLSIPFNDQVRFIKFIELGKDAEFWAGHYGAQFTAENLALICYNQERDLLKMIKPRTFYELPIQTYFNDAIGESCYIDGIKHKHPKGFYNNLNDFDLFMTYPTKKIPESSQNYELSLYFMEAWNGSSCLKIKGDLESKKQYILKLFKTDISTKSNLVLTINTKQFDKKQVKYNIYEKKVSVQIVFKYQDKSRQAFKPTKVALNNGWDSVQFQISPQQQNIKGIYLVLENITNNSILIEGLLGGFGLYDDDQIEIMKQIGVDFKDPTRYVKNIQLKESLTNNYDLYIQLDFGQELEQLIKTVRIFNDKTWLGNQRSTYGYYSEVPFDGQELFVKIQLVLNNGHHIKSDSILPVIIYKDQVIHLD